MSVTGPGEDARLDATGPWRDEWERREQEAADEAALDEDDEPQID